MPLIGVWSSRVKRLVPAGDKIVTIINGYGSSQETGPTLGQGIEWAQDCGGA